LQKKLKLFFSSDSFGLNTCIVWEKLFRKRTGLSSLWMNSSVNPKNEPDEIFWGKNPLKGFEWSSHSQKKWKKGVQTNFSPRRFLGLKRLVKWWWRSFEFWRKIKFNFLKESIKTRKTENKSFSQWGG